MKRFIPPEGAKPTRGRTVVSLTNRRDLAKIKSRALRTRVWFKAISKVERAIIDLTIRCVETVRSNILADAISTIVSKILQSLEEGFMVRAERAGHEIAEKLCAIGEGWGNGVSSSWKCDKCFVKYLGVNALNSSK